MHFGCNIKMDIGRKSCYNYLVCNNFLFCNRFLFYDNLRKNRQNRQKVKKNLVKT